MRARPEPTQLEHISDAFFLGKLLALPANVRLDWQVIARYKHSSLFGLISSSKEGKKFYKIDTRSWPPGSNPEILRRHLCLAVAVVIKLSPLELNKLEHLSLSSIFS